MQKIGVDIENTIAIGDTNGDLCMVKQAGIGIAFMPKDNILINEAKNQVNIPDMIDIL